MKTLNDLADTSLAVLGRERMESTKRRWSLAWLIVAILTARVASGLSRPRDQRPVRSGERRRWRSSKSEGLRFAARGAGDGALRGLPGAAAPGHLAGWTRRTNSAPASRPRGAGAGQAWPWRSIAHRHEAA